MAYSIANTCTQSSKYDSKRLLNDGERQVDGIRRRRLRTPSPVQDDVRDLKSKLLHMKQTFGGIHDHPETIIPDALQSLTVSSQYVDMQLLSRNASHCQDILSNVQKANSAIHHLAPRFLEGIAISSEGLFIFITQVEVDLRDVSSVDDCANSTITLGYSARLTKARAQKSMANLSLWSQDASMGW